MDRVMSIFLALFFVNGYINHGKTESSALKATENDQSTSSMGTVHEVMQFFSQDDPKGIPMVYIPDPLRIPLDYNLSTTLSISDQTIQGLSQIRLHTFIVDLSNNMVHAEASIPYVNFMGRYVWLSMMWGDATGGITNITMTDVELCLDFRVNVDNNGALRINRENITFQLLHHKLSAEFENLSSMYAFVAKLALPNVIPSLLSWVEDWLHETLNYSFTTALVVYFPDSVPCIDFLIMQVRTSIRKAALDPLPIGSFTIDVGYGLSLSYDYVTLRGLSTLHRLQDLQAKLIDNTLMLLIQIGAQPVEISGLCGLPYTSFFHSPLTVHVDFITITVEVHQRTHLKSPPTLRVLKLGLGNMEVKSSVLGTLDYLTEAVANIMPNLLRSKIVEKLEPLVWKVLQQQLNALDFQAIFDHQLIKQEKTLDQRGISQ